MKIKELREMSVEALAKHRRELLTEALHMRIQQQSSQVENPSRLRLIRREVARIATILTERASKTTAAA